MPAEIDRARKSGQFVARVLTMLLERTKVGTKLLEINAWAADMITEAGAVSCYIDYVPSFGSGPFGHVICTSVNEAVLHGRPRDYDLWGGDLLTLDFAVSQGRMVADAAVSSIVGTPREPEDQRLIDTTRTPPGRRHRRSPAGRPDRRAGRGYTLQPCLVIAIEPWVMAHTAQLRIDADGWTLLSATGARTAHTEHTVAITENGPEILTAWLG